MDVTIWTETGLLRLDAEALDTAVFLANVFGYSLDLEPNGNSYTLTAEHWRSQNRIVAKGKTIKATAKKLIELLTSEVKDD